MKLPVTLFRVRQWVNRLRPVSKMLEALWHARSGSWLERALLVPAILPEVLDVALGVDSAETLGIRSWVFFGPSTSTRSIKQYAEMCLETSGPSNAAAGTYTVFHDAHGAAVYSAGNGDHLWVRDTEVSSRALAWAAAQLWAQSDAYTLETSKEASTRAPMLVPRAPSATVHAGARAERICSRLAQLPPGEARTLLFYGPSGSGKSTTARMVADRYGRVLAVRPRVLRLVGFGEVQAMIHVYRPRVLIFDDLNPSQLDDGLEVLEEVRAMGLLAIITLMGDTRLQDALQGKRGSMCFDGMRPGRIDGFEVFDYASDSERRAVLGIWVAHFGVSVPPELMDRLVHETAGLTNAYLRELVLQIHTYGLAEVDAALRMLWMQAPTPRPTVQDKP